MGVRKNESMGFFDAVMVESGGPRSAALLEKLDAATPWERLAAPIRKLPEYNNAGAGHPPWCPVLMLKYLMLQKWNNLSDPGLEEALKDRISFRRFVGLSFTAKTPDGTTFVRFRTRLREADSAYSKEERREALRARGVIDGSCYQRRPGQDELRDWQKRWNRCISRLQAHVEHPTAMMKQQLGCRLVRYRGRDRNALDFALTLAACNLKRSLCLRARKAAA